MIDLEIEVDVGRASLFLQGMKGGAIAKAESRSLNKVIVTVRKEAVQHVHKVRRLRKTAIRKSMHLVRANPKQLVAKIKASNRPISLKEYSAKVGGRKGAKRVVINVSGQRKILQHAFIVEKLGGHVFERKGKSALPIRRLSGPSIGSALIKQSVKQALSQVVATRWPVVFEREINYEIDKQRRK